MDFKVGQVWQHTNPENPGPSRWEIERIDSASVRIHLKRLEDKVNGTTQSLHYKPMQLLENGLWSMEKDVPNCPQCEERPKLDGDYLCQHCRYGID
jgi:hypothetical protein